MGHGPARTLATGDDTEIPLDPGVASRLDEALARLDALDAKFRMGRDEERFALATKLWHRACAELDTHLRTLAKVLIRTHQLNLDIGCEGGGVKAMPWFEEMGQTFERLSFKLENLQVVAFSGREVLGSVAVSAMTYAWIEQMAGEWIVRAVANKG